MSQASETRIWSPSAIRDVLEDDFGAIDETDRSALITNGIISTTEVAGNVLKGLLPSGEFVEEAAYILHVRGRRESAVTDSWYLYDGQNKKGKFMIISEKTWLGRESMPGLKKVTLVYLHLVPDSSTPHESLKYTIGITKRETQLALDFKTMLSAVSPFSTRESSGRAKKIGTSSATTIETDLIPSTIAISVDGFQDPKKTSSVTAEQPDAGTPPAPNSSKSLSKISYINEKPTWIGIGFAVPITEYDQVEYDKGSGILQPKKISKQDGYVALDIFIPPVEAGMSGYRYLPHPFIAIPVTGKVLRRPMAGLGIGLYGVELFYGAVYDMESRDVVGARDPKWESVYGIKVSASAAKKAFSAVVGK